MDLSSLLFSLPHKKGTIHTFLGGKIEHHPHARLAQDVAETSARLRGWGVTAGMRVGIYAPNSYRWLVHDLALIALRAISVPFTADFAGAVDQALLDRYNISLLLLGRRDGGLFSPRPPHVAFLDADNGDVAVMARAPSGDADIADQLSLVFSSGSAGGLKGLVVSRTGVEETLPPIFTTIGLGHHDRLLLFLPMSNFQQRSMCYGALHYDFDLIITDYTGLFGAMRQLDPTVLLAPPVFYQMIFAQYNRSAGAVRALQGAVPRVLSLLPAMGLRRALARRIFPEFHGQFGRRMRILITGMAPIRRDIGAFFAAVQLPLSESYGLMEAGSITYRPAASRKFDSVGKVLPGITLKFRDDGEILVVRPHQLTLRYFQCAEGENERTFIGGRKVATGDVGRLDADGNLFLMGRKKELIVTPGGYKIHPEIIEQEINNCPDVAHSVIFLKPGASQLTCIIDLNPPADEDARARVKKHVAGLSSTRRAAQFVDMIFADEAFSRDNGLLRPNLKIDRRAIEARFGR